MQRKLFFLILFFFVFCSSSFADTLLLKNGDRLTGKVVRLEEEGELLFKSDMLGDITVDMKKVKNFNTDEPIEIHLKDGTVIKAKALFDGEGRFVIKKEETQKPQTFAISEVEKINPYKVKWSGNLTVGFNSSKADSLDESLNADARITRRTEKSRTRLEGYYLFARERKAGEAESKTTDDVFTIDGQHNQFFKKKIYGFANGRYKKDNVEDLDYRLIAGLGPGYQWIDTKKIEFSTEMGLAYVEESYTSINPDTGLEEEEVKEDLSSQFGYNLELNPIKRVKFLSKLKYYPSFEKFSDYFLNWDGELQITFRRPIFASFKAILDYDSSPIDRASNSDIKYLIGIGVNF